MENGGFMILFLKKLCVISLLLVPGYNLCMENSPNHGKQGVEQIALELPKDMMCEVIKQTLIAMIKEYDNCQDKSNKLKIFLKQFLNLQLVSKQVKNFLVEPNGKKIKYFAPHEPLLVAAAQLNSNILCELILQNLKVSQDDLNYALLFAATHRNKKIFNLLKSYGATEKLIEKVLETTTDELFRKVFFNFNNLEFIDNRGFSKLAKIFDLNLVNLFSNKNIECNYNFCKFFLINGINLNSYRIDTLLRVYWCRKSKISESIGELFIAYGANVNAQDSNGQTILMLLASYEDAEDTVKFFLKHGADKSMRDVWHRTAHSYAMHDNMKRLLKEDDKEENNSKRCVVS